MNTAGWHDLLVASVGAGSALAGLIFVAVSLNVKTMLAIPSMTSRAATTIAALILVVIVGIAGLMPIASTTPGIVGAVASAVVVIVAIRSSALIMRGRGSRSMRDAALKGALGSIPPTITLVGCVLLATGGSAAVEVIALSFLLIFASSITNAWVILVEILR